MSVGKNGQGIERIINKVNKTVVFKKTSNDRSWVNAFATLPELIEATVYKFRITFIRSYIASFAFGLITSDLDLTKFPEFRKEANETSPFYGIYPRFPKRYPCNIPSFVSNVSKREFNMWKYKE